jgi:hypothetical protein
MKANPAFPGKSGGLNWSMQHRLIEFSQNPRVCKFASVADTPFS